MIQTGAHRDRDRSASACLTPASIFNITRPSLINFETFEVRNFLCELKVQPSRLYLLHSLFN